MIRVCLEFRFSKILTFYYKFYEIMHKKITLNYILKGILLYYFFQIINKIEKQKHILQLISYSLS